jgi:preprotein translocase subunit SecE
MARLQRKKQPTIKRKKTDPGEGKALVSGESTAGSAGPEGGEPVKEVRRKSAPAPVRRLPAEPKTRGKVGQWVEQAVQFLREVKIELKKVTWPSRKQTIGSTAVVIILVMVVSIFLGVVDVGLSSLIRVVLQ